MTTALGWTAVAIAPSIATALTRYPKTKGVGAFLLALLDRLSFLTHRDAQGTLKLPVVRSKAPEPDAKP